MTESRLVRRRREGAFFLACLIGLLTLAAACAAPLDRFETSIAAFEAHDRAAPPAAGGTVFVGSSTFARWTSLEREFAAFHALNRGFGGSTIPECTYYVDRIVAPYRPSRVVLYAGTNDIADGRSGQQVCADFRAFVAKVRTRLPQARIFFISMNVPPSRVRYTAQYEEGNACIKSWIATQSNVFWIDVAADMYDAAGQPRPELYTDDMLHMNAKGYARWILPIKRALAEH